VLSRLFSGGGSFVAGEALPVGNIDRLELILNLRTARELGLTIPPSIVVPADHVIK